MAKRVMVQEGKTIPKREGTAHAGGFDCPTQFVGKGSWVGSDGGGVNVYVEPATGPPGLAIAQNILPRMDALMVYCDHVFGVRGKGGNVILCSSPFNGATDGSGGAYHYGCGFGSGQSGGGSDWYENVALGNPDMTFGLVMAEVSESWMGLHGRGWNCGGSGGEGLSRFLAEIVSGGPSGALSAFSSASSWDGADWISRDQGTDQDYPSIGCAVLYCWWMVSLGVTPAQIIQTGEPDGTLASNYAALTGRPATEAFTRFSAAVALVGHARDNPWGTPTPPYPLPAPPAPAPGPQPTPLFSRTFNRTVKKGGLVWFPAPVDIPTGSVLEVFAPARNFEEALGESPLD